MEVKIGLETHVQLNTKTKLFCRCKNTTETKDANTFTCPTCLGMPGSKPRLNKAAFEKALKVALFFGCKIPKTIVFSRKSYFYPDLSKNYQITQYEYPVGEKGNFIFCGKKAKIRRIQLEEDPAKIVHVGGSILTAQYIRLDYNRSGTPLIEIVTDPCFKNIDEVEKYLKELKKVLFYLEVYKDGEIKSDCNISVSGGRRVEIKNISGIKNVIYALKHEIKLQKKKKNKTEETKAWNADKQKTELLRKKEGEADYGYIFEPDLSVIKIGNKEIKKIEKTLPKSPEKKFKELTLKNIGKERAKIISSDYQLLKLFENVSKEVEIMEAANLVSGPIKKNINYFDIDLSETKLSEIVIQIIKQYKKGKITDRGLELSFRKALQGDYEISKFEKISEKEIEKIVKEVLKKNKNVVKKIKKGKKSALEFLIGQVIKQSKGRADPNIVREIIQKTLDI